MEVPNTFETNVRWTDNVQGIATSNGRRLDAVLTKSTGEYSTMFQLVLASPQQEMLCDMHCL